MNILPSQILFRCTPLKNFMLKTLPLIAVWLLVIGLSICYLINLYQLLSKSYYVDQSRLYKIDTFHLLNRAYQQSDNSGGRSSNSKLIFESTNRYSFVIDKSFFYAITDRKKLEDTLMYHDLKFTVFSDKKTFDEYKDSKSPILIRVYQIQIGDTKYIDVSNINSIINGEKIGLVIFPPAVIFVMFLLIKKFSK